MGPAARWAHRALPSGPLRAPHPPFGPRPRDPLANSGRGPFGGPLRGVRTARGAAFDGSRDPTGRVVPQRRGAPSAGYCTADPTCRSGINRSWLQ
jgi:hypothetical protein